MNDKFNNLRKFDGFDILSESQIERISKLNTDAFFIDNQNNYIMPKNNSNFHPSFMNSENSRRIAFCKVAHKIKYFENFSLTNPDDWIVDPEITVLHSLKKEGIIIHNDVDHMVFLPSKLRANEPTLSYFDDKEKLIYFNSIERGMNPDRFTHSEVMFSLMADFKASDSSLVEFNETINMSYNNYKDSNAKSFSNYDSFFSNNNGMRGRGRLISLDSPCSSVDSNNSRNISMLASKMIYFDLSKDYDDSEELRKFASSCYKMIESIVFDNNAEDSQIYKRVFADIHRVRNFSEEINFDYYVRMYNRFNDNLISLMTELAFIHSDKNNLILSSEENFSKILEKFIKNSLSPQNISLGCSLAYSIFLRKPSLVNDIFLPKKFKTYHIEQRQMLYVAAINSGNLNKKVISRISVDNSYLSPVLDFSLFESRFFYKNSKIIKQLNTIVWSKLNYGILITYISFLKKEDVAMLLSLNVMEDKFYKSEFYEYKKIIEKKIHAISI